MPKTSFARPSPGGTSAPASPRPPMPPPRPGATTATTTAAAPLPPRRPAPPAPAQQPPPPVVETEVLPPAPMKTPQPQAPAAVPPPARRGRPAGATNKPKTPEQPPTSSGTQLAVVDDGLGRVVLFTGKAGRIEGDIDQSDFTLPQLKIANAVGPLALLDDPIIPGALVIGAAEQWLYLFNGEGWEPLGVTVIRARKEFAQTKNENGGNLYDLDEMGLVAETVEELKAMGGTLQDVRGLKVFEAVMKAHVLIRLPDNLEDPMGLFDLEIEGVLHAQAIWKIRGSSYRDCAKKIYDESKEGRFIDGVNGNAYDGEFLMTAKRIVGDKNAWFIPHIENGEFTTEAFRATAATL